MTRISNWASWEEHFATFLTEQMEPVDAAHDLSHIQRVVMNARILAAAEQAQLEIVLPAAWLHDCIVMPKDSPQRSQASRLAADAAGRFLQDSGYPSQYIPAIQHAIAAHSFSAGIEPRTREALIVRDADRLDALGALGIARCLMIGGALGRQLYDPAEPFPTTRPADDQRYTIDHFYVKLLKLVDSFATAAGRAEAERRTAFMQAFLEQLGSEIKPTEG